MHQLLNESRDRVDRTYETLDAVRRLFESVEDAETGQRGFVITGDESYLMPFSSALETAPKTYSMLQAPVPGGTTPPDSVIQLEHLISADLAELQHGIDVRRREGSEAARAEIKAGKG